ncbi:type IV secretion system protein [Campylobacter helveticus]|uniref:type IV secretion system protein n=1 Tax=Campylobacter helveticus TaxID=28898 RepID=UPI001112951A|nr:type IV secretion system protein [Campylobacter helveticus]TNB63265.1 type IV secretion system protein [Campylobacter helveticus]
MANSTSIGEMNWFGKIQSALQSIITQANQGIYEGTSALIHNTMSYTIVLTTILVWLILRLKNGYPSKDEMFSAGKWLLLVLFIYAVFYSYESYKGFASLFLLPANWVKTIVTYAMGLQGGDFINTLSQSSDKIQEVCRDLMKEIEKDNTGIFTIGEDFLITFAIIGCFWFWIYVAIVYIALFGGLLIITGATFITILLLCASPILIPFILYRSTRAYFFSYLKLVISYSLYPSIALIIISIVTSSINDFGNQAGKPSVAKQIYDETFAFCFPLILITILGIYFLTKIPNWVSQIMGVQGLDAGGTGAGLSVAKTAGMATGVGLGTGAVKGVAGAISGYKGAGGGLKGLASGALGGMKGGLDGALGGAAKQLPGNKTTQAAMRFASSSIGKAIKGNNGATASAG